MSLGFLGCLIVPGSLYSRAAESESRTVAIEVLAQVSGATAPGLLPFDAACSDSMLANPLETGGDDGVAFEDSVEMLRVNTQQRTFGIGPGVMGSKLASTAAQNTRPNYSPPLLV